MAVTRVGHVELFVPDLEAARHFYVDVLGLTLTDADPGHLYLRAGEEFEHHTMVLTKADRNGLGHLALRVDDPEDLHRLQRSYEQQGIKVLRVPAGAEAGQGEAIRLRDPLGFPVEFYHAMERVERKLRKYEGIAPTRFDHVNLRVPDNVEKGVEYYRQQLGFYVSEYAEYADGKLFSAWMHRKQTTHDVALVRGPGTLIHHAAFYVADAMSVVRTADLMADAGMRDGLEFGPGRHGITNAFFFYIKDPAGNRLEIYNGDYLIPDPDFKPIRWTHEEFEATGRLLWGARPPQSMYEGQQVADWTNPPMPK